MGWPGRDPLIDRKIDIESFDVNLSQYRLKKSAEEAAGAEIHRSVGGLVAGVGAGAATLAAAGLGAGAAAGFAVLLAPAARAALPSGEL
jgi:hypothetical protein